MLSYSTNDLSNSQQKKKFTVQEKNDNACNDKNITEQLSRYENAVNDGQSQREAIGQLKTPRSTFRDLLSRIQNSALPDSVVQFALTPDGEAFIHRVVVAAQHTFLESSHASIRDMVSFLDLSRLNQLFGGSYGAVQNLSLQMQDSIIEFEKTERERLTKDMPQKKISICEDETFHPQPCLVAIEPISGFILTESYREKRDADNWNHVLKEATSDLNIDVIQSVSDEAPGIKKHAKTLGAHHSPDLFHVQQEITKAMSRALSSKTESAETAYIKATKEYKEDNKQLDDIKAELKKCKQRQKIVRQTKCCINESYHPFNLKNGKHQKSDQVGKKIDRQFERLEKVANEAELSDKSNNRLKKARKVVTSMLATISFFWQMVEAELEVLGLSLELENLLKNVVMPSIYFLIVAKKTKNKKLKKYLIRGAQRLKKSYSSSLHWKNMSIDEQQKALKSAEDCVNYFQRSSSCVEGRNSHLSLFHHSHHKLSERKLKVKTIIHNFFNRDNNSLPTPAEKFFGKRTEDLFDWLVTQIKLPSSPRPTKKQKAGVVIM